ncbi:MOSC domain-containing protein [Deinococcus sp.]|uniref:MOSC domain-containing protein n=1 Tax=Deinococcus sp. TaxID=47478 RepID=UPI0025F46E19|nr:MOSC domain-containing protein [Deinococcus sp.]
MKLLSVNIGQPRPVEAKDGLSGIFKQPQVGAVWLASLGLSGDHIQDKQHHGGPDQAVYVYTQPDYDHFSALLGRDLAPGTFGENLLIPELESAPVAIGTRLRVGAALLEVTAARIPCATLAARMSDPQFVKVFREQRRPGLYARVLEEGPVQAGDAVQVEFAPQEGAATVLDTFEYFYAKVPTPAQITKLLAAPALHAKMRSELAARLAKVGG